MTPVVVTGGVTDFSEERAAIRALPEVQPQTNGVHLGWELRDAAEHSAAGTWRRHLPTL